MDKSVLKNKPFLFILFTGFLSILGIGIIIPVTPFIIGKLVRSPGEIATYVGIITSLYAFCQFFSAPVLGALSDKFGRRPVLLICQLGSAIGYILFGIGGSLWIIFLGRIIDGITGGDVTTAMAYVADVTEPRERGKYFGVIGALVGFGFIIGPTIGGLAANISLSAPLYIAAGLSIINMMYGYFVLPESHKKENRTADFSLHHLNPFVQLQFVLKKKNLMNLIIIGVFYFLAFSEIISITSVFYANILHWTPANIGLYFLVLGIFDMITQGYVSGKLIDKFGTLPIVLSGFFVTAFAYCINAIIPIFPYAVLAFIYIIIYSFGSGLFEPAYGALVSTAASPQEQGRVQGASQSIQSIARILGPLLAAYLYQFSPSFPWISCIVFSLIGAYLLIKKKKAITRGV